MREIVVTAPGQPPLAAVEDLAGHTVSTTMGSSAEAFAHEDDYGLAVIASEDAKEGPKAFKEKRTPNWQRK